MLAALKKRKELLLVFAIAFLAATLKFSGCLDGVTAESLRVKLLAAGPWTPVLFLAVYLVLSFAFFPGSVFFILASALFEETTAVLLSLIGAGSTAVAGYGVGRFGGKKLVERLILKRPAAFRLKVRFAERPVFLVLLLRYLPVPNIVQSMLCGALNVAFPQYVIVSILEVIPWIVGFVYFGRGIFSGQGTAAIAGVIVLFFVFLVGTYLKKKI